MKDVSLATGLREATYLIYASGVNKFQLNPPFKKQHF